MSKTLVLSSSWSFELELESGREVCLHFVQTTVGDVGRMADGGRLYSAPRTCRFTTGA